MQLLILVLFIGLFMHDALTARPAGEIADPFIGGIPMAWAIVFVLVPKLLIGAIYHGLCRRAARRLGAAHGRATLRRLERAGAILRNLVASSYLLDLFAFSALLGLRRTVGDMVLVDELLVMLPTLAVTVWMWTAYYPVDVAMRQVTFMNRLEQGLAVHIWTRGQYLVSQLRHQWALMGLPLLLLMGWWELVQKLFDERTSPDLMAGMMMGGALLVFLFTPVMIRHVWDTVPLPAGPLRDKLVSMCRTYRVGIRELLLWRTFGGMINGAVMGLVAPLRYILLTDGLLETMPARQVEAVMAHELAHVRKHHMFWLLAVAAGSMDLLRRATEATLDWSLGGISGGGAAGYLPEPVVAAMTHPDTPQVAAMIFSTAMWFFVFGWVSRRFERQADTFAVQHLARQWHLDRQSQRDWDHFTATRGEPWPAMASAPADPAVSPAPCADSASLPGPPPLPALPPAAELTAALERGDAAGLAPGREPAAATDASRIPPAAADVMAGALQSVADLNCIPIRRNSWRHGSIAWRQDYLRSLTGAPIEETAIDHQVRLIKIAGIVILATSIALGFWL